MNKGAVGPKKSPRAAMFRIIAVALLAAPLWWPLAADFLAPDDGGTNTANHLGKQPRMMELDEVIFLQDRNGKQEVNLTAQHAATADANEYMKLFEVETKVTDANGGIARITGDEALYEQNRQAITLTGKVKVLMEKLTATSERVSYFTEHQRIETTEPVRIEAKELTVTGTGLDYDLTSGRMKMGGQGPGRVFCAIH